MQTHNIHARLPLPLLLKLKFILIERLLLLTHLLKLLAHSHTVDIVHLTQAVVEPITEQLILELLSEELVELLLPRSLYAVYRCVTVFPP